MLYTEAGRLPEAEAAFKQLLALDRPNIDRSCVSEDEAVIFHNYAMLLEKMGRTAESKAMEDKADSIMAAKKKAMEDLMK